MTIQQAFELALQHHKMGQLAEAEALYRQILTVDPGHADALHLLGVMAHQTNRHEAAVELIRRAISLTPEVPSFYSNLGEAYRVTGQLDEAITAYRQAIALKPDYPDAYSNLGNTLREKGELDESIAACRQAIVLDPNHAAAHSNLGNALYKKGQLDEAIAAYRRAVALQPNYPDAYSNLGSALRDQGQVTEAIAACRQAIALRPHFAVAYNNLGNALSDSGQLDEAIAGYQQAIQCDPGYADAHSNMGGALKDVGRLDEAIAALRHALFLKPDEAVIHSNVVYILHFHPACGATIIREEHRLWNQQHAEPLRKFIQPHPNDRSPERRLRIGYVSPDFREHVVGYNMLPLLARHDHEHFEIFCYSQVARADALTERFEAIAPHWRSTVGLTDEQFTAQVREDQIDILVDLALHMARNRLPVFARKPAPVQVTFAGYPGSTGLSTIDYRLSDRWLESESFPGRERSPSVPSPLLANTEDGECSASFPYLHQAERAFLLDSFWCYDPLDCGDIPVNALPASTNGFLTFGCLNNFCKINDMVLHLWAKVLRAVASSRLLLLTPEGSHRQHTLDVLSQEGIAGERIEFIARQPRRKYLELYHRIDLGLDTLPYNGHSTSLDSFWMGVPVITLVGQTIVGRAGLSQSMNLSLPELIATTPEQYVETAVGLANDLPRLSDLRRTLRARMEQSPLMDAPRFARDIEAAYRTMWRWCREEKPARP